MYTTNRRTTRHLALPGMVAILLGIAIVIWIVVQVVLPVLLAMSQATNVLAG